MGVKPKLFWANERTLLLWLRISIVLGAFGLALLKAQEAHTALLGRIGIGPGIFVLCSAAVMDVYALYQFRKKLNMLLAKRDVMEQRGKVFPYLDRVGPMVVGAVVVAAIGLNTGIWFDKLPASSAPCQANLVIIRHGEVPVNDRFGNLSAVGFNRSEYLSRCATHRTSALSMGPPTALMAFAWRGAGTSHRGIDTIAPLSVALGLDIDKSVQKDDVPGFLAGVRRNLQCNGTLLVAWQHDNLPVILDALDPPNGRSCCREWPTTCPSASFPEPAPDHGQGGSNCFDQIWQMPMSKWAADDEWIVGSVQTSHEGFGKSADSACAQGMAAV